MNFLNTQLVG